MRYRLGVDVGGTFTDLLLIDQQTNQTVRDKVPSTPHDPSIAVINGLERVCAKANISPKDIAHLMHGTTVATNAVLEGKGARVGLIVTAGFRQILQVARSYVPGGLAGWIVWPKPEPLAKLEDTIEASERVNAFGDVVQPLDEHRLIEDLKTLKTNEVEAITISLINSFANDVHERRIAEIVADVIPEIPISLSSKILPEIKEYERTLTTVANSYVRPSASRYLQRLDHQLKALTGELQFHILRSDGGLMGVDIASSAPVSMLMSGPAGGVSGALWIASQAGYKDLLTLDMGGTSTDVALVQGGKPSIGRETTVGDLTIRSSSVDVRTVGAGGGSIAHVPELTKALRVGPQSAGAVPGPAAYGKGGTEATVTDANVVLGYLPTSLLGGEMKLDSKAAFEAVGKIAEALSVDVYSAAEGIIDIVNENMFGALRLVSVQQGYDPRDYALVAFGGAGPLHANALGALMGSWPVIVPPSPGVLCAYGDATTNLKAESSKTFIRQFPDTSKEEVILQLRDLAETARSELQSEGVRDEEIVQSFEIDLRYHGQGFEVTVPVKIEEIDKNGLEVVGEVFDKEHERMFTFALDSVHEIVNLRAVVTATQNTVEAPRLNPGDGDPVQAERFESEIRYGGKIYNAKVYDRSLLESGDIIDGPAILTEMDSTTLIIPEHFGTVDNFGNVLIRPNTQREA
ncbi:N-methylhydantoinase A [Ferrithrix thermotolerans DSM 19514]|uniref:N-methylhydantoinase A n=1 Tax=Ferrithrix thermotolerans DSM 19514 TaxID=1121881 RepID=A0A1M4XNH4_9ACTN|nr:hydantoinase/oxoprolinase family protein [Ferrithrix thermotolerans]SHE95154.1 N-methylhydantoinase A [Ferrithrix thermotolerans DSM 19514]